MQLLINEMTPGQRGWTLEGMGYLVYISEVICRQSRGGTEVPGQVITCAVTLRYNSNLSFKWLPIGVIIK